MTNDWVLMYHRVCRREPATECWFERGTAVTPDAFALQLAWIAERYLIVGLHELLAAPSRIGRSRVALTFDDGYAEVAGVVATMCRSLGVVGTCFVPAAPVFTREPLWFDAWYACVAVGRELPAWRARIQAWGGPLADDLRGWAFGAPRRWLAALAADERRDRLRALAHLAGVAEGAVPYVGLGDLRLLVSRGWAIGGHGAVHERLTDCDEHALGAELAASRSLLDDTGGDGAALFAYPDGAWDQRVVQRVAQAGFAAACTVEPGPVTAGVSRLQLPRLFCRGAGPIPHPALGARGELTP